MKLREIYELAVQKGIQADPRGRKKVLEDLDKRREEYDKLEEEDKKFFDLERLENPYDDTRILWGDPETEVNSILAGIDIDSAELLLADRLRERGEHFDLVIGHHPQGKALARLHGVMDIQEDILFSMGVPINVAEGLMIPRIAEVERSVLPSNHNKPVDAARLLDIPFMCIHTPADNNVVHYLEELFERKNPKTVGEVLDLLKEVPEYSQAVKLNAGPKIVVGSEDRRTGRIFVDMTGGTGGSEDAYSKLSEAGVGTIVCMHMGEKHRKEAEKNHINVVIAGHMASDSIGLNLVLDQLEAKGINIEPCAGLIRHSRN
ncbi:MAG TPA: NGG1p interacting factor NIF3 [Clostridia bacterium]|nr:NGG1p interacting factor NIF3 [Clostridia bacterium]